MSAVRERRGPVVVESGAVDREAASEFQEGDGIESSNYKRGVRGSTTLAQLAAEIGLEITVMDYPPGTSKRNKIEHRVFSFISGNWRGQPLTDRRTIVELIGATTTQTGLVVHADYDNTWCPKVPR